MSFSLKMENIENSLIGIHKYTNTKVNLRGGTLSGEATWLDLGLDDQRVHSTLPAPAAAPTASQIFKCKYTNTYTQTHKYKYTNANPQKQIHKYKYRNTSIKIQIHKCKYTNTKTQVQIHKCKYSNTNTQVKIHVTSF